VIFLEISLILQDFYAVSRVSSTKICKTHVFQCDRAVVEEVLNKEYISQSERLRALWALMGFDEAAVLYDIHDYDRLEKYYAEALEGFEVIKVP